MKFKIMIWTMMLMALVTTTFAQKQNKRKKSSEAVRSTSREPFHVERESKKYTPGRKQADWKVSYHPEEAFHRQMKTLAKERRKAERMAETPQYSDPMYFGHKRRPKKHKAGKLKFCKECGIRH